MKRAIKRAVRAALLSPLGIPLARLYAGRATCLMYHRISRGSETPADSPNRDLFVSEEQFDAQMRLLSQEYECLSLPDAVALLQRGKLPRRSVVVTFDDGYRDNLLALPILRRYNVPATIYVTTAAVDRTRPLWWDEQESIVKRLARLQFEWRGVQYDLDLSTPAKKVDSFVQLNKLFKASTPPQQEELMTVLRDRAAHSEIVGPLFAEETILSWDEVLELDREPLVTIGAHTCDHFVMSQLDDDELRRQLAGSKAELERRLGHVVDHFAYPFGGAEHAAAREFVAAGEAGFTSAVTTRPGHWHASSRKQMHALPRIAVDFRDSLEDFRWKLSGLAVAAHQPLRFLSPVPALPQLVAAFALTASRFDFESLPELF